MCWFIYRKSINVAILCIDECSRTDAPTRYITALKRRRRQLLSADAHRVLTDFVDEFYALPVWRRPLYMSFAGQCYESIPPCAVCVFGEHTMFMCASPMLVHRSTE